MPPPLLALRNATSLPAGRPLFTGLEVAVARGDRICLIGRNGSGKSTLLKVLAGVVDLDEGERFVQPRTTIAYLPQEPADGPEPEALGHVLAALPAHEEPERGRARAEALLERLGMSPDARLKALSGGELRRVSLARTLVSAPDILLLDEPTNHLDMPTIEWLERELSGFAGGIVMVSHDRAFLRALGRRLWWLDRGRLLTRDAGFDRFEAWAEEVLAAEEADIARLDKRLEAEQHWLHRGVTARRKRNQGRIRRLAQMRALRRSHLAPAGRVRMSAEAGPASGRMVIEAENVTKAYDGQPIVPPFSTRILRGDRIGIIGPNGSGKTTLLKLLTGELAPDSGKIRHGTQLTLSVFDQTRAQLDSEASPWENLCPDGGDQVLVQGQFRHVVGYLRDFLFREDQLRTPVRALSGGERNRLLLAKVLARPSNLLVLDEPTNDLDMDTLDLLQEVLADYEGTLLLVSHDRDFLDRLVTSVIAFEAPGEVQEYAGGYGDYLRARPQPSEPVTSKPPAAAREPATRRRGSPPTRLLRELERVQKEIARLEAEKATLEARLADPGLYARDPDGFASASARLAALPAELAASEELWLEREMEREAYEAG